MKEHTTRCSDSSLYDMVCTTCHGTDAAGDDRLNHPCEGSVQEGLIAEVRRDVVRLEKRLEERKLVLLGLEAAQ